MAPFPVMFDYISPRSLREVLEITSAREDVSVFAGGTDILIKIRDGFISPGLLIDLKKIDELWLLSFEREKELVIGAINTLSEILESPATRKFFPLLIECCLRIGSHELRNKATLVGNICSGFPLADSLFALLIYDSEIEITSLTGKSRKKLVEAINEDGKISLKKGEIVTKVFIPYEGEHQASYYRLTDRFLVPRASFGIAYLKSEKKTKIAIGSIDSKISMLSLEELRELLEKGYFKREEELLLSNKVIEDLEWRLRK